MPSEAIDTVLSLGGSCIAALQLKRRGLRRSSMPFDWLFHVSDQCLDALAEGFENDFASWLRKENLRELRAEERGTSHCHQYVDMSTGYRYIHDFPRPMESTTGLYDEVLGKYRRRFDRMTRAIDESARVMMVLNSKWPVGSQKVAGLHRTLKSRWPDKEFLIRVVAFGLAEDEVDQVNDECTIWRYRREENDYDYYQTNWEWAFLDDIRLRGATKARRRDSIRVRLARRGFGVDVQIGRLEE